MPNPRVVYETMLEELAAGEMNALQKKIFDLLRAHPEGMTRYDLVASIFGYRPVTLDGNTQDRKIRKAIEALRKRLYPIVSTSHSPGYRLDVSHEAAEKMRAELMNRKKNIEAQIDAIGQFHKLPGVPGAYKPPRRLKKPTQATQLEMTL